MTCKHEYKTAQLEQSVTLFHTLSQMFGRSYRSSINFQTQEVPDFLPLKFGSPTGKSRKSHFFSMLQLSALCLAEHGFLFQCHTESSWSILLSDLCVLKTSLSLIKIRSHLFGKPVLVCRTLEKVLTLVQFRISFKAQRKKKENKKHERKCPKHVFLKINYAEITLQTCI